MQPVIKERPILFSGAMVRALLNGSKTQTRRATGLDKVNEKPNTWARQWIPNTGRWHWLFTATGQEDVYLRCPYGVEGDRLWVRESFAQHGRGKCHGMLGYPSGYSATLYQAEGKETYPNGEAVKWKPSIFMPRAASRLLLEITAVRCERLQGISEADAVAEGVESCIADLARFGARARGMKLFRDYERKENSLTAERGTGFSEAVPSYESLWASINGPDSWAANPWVWVVEFKIIEGKEVASV